MKQRAASNQKGRDFEISIAKQLRRKGFPAYRDSRSGAGDLYKADIAAPGFFAHVEAKAQSTIKLMDWWHQTVQGCPVYRRPVLAIQADSGEQLAVMTLDDFLNLVKQVADDTETIMELRRESTHAK